MKTKTSSLALTKAFFISLVVCCLLSCSHEKQIDKTNMSEILSKCKGHAIIVAKGYNDGNFKPFRHYLIIRDDSLNCFEYIGADYKLSVGDTLK